MMLSVTLLKPLVVLSLHACFVSEVCMVSRKLARPSPPSGSQASPRCPRRALFRTRVDCETLKCLYRGDSGDFHLALAGEGQSGKSWCREPRDRLRWLSPQHGTRPCVTGWGRRLRALGQSSPWRQGRGLRGLPLCPGQAMLAVWLGVPGGGCGALWEANAHPGNRRVPHQGPLAPCMEGTPGRAVWTSQQSGSGVCGRKRGVAGRGARGAAEAPVSVGGERGRPGRRALGTSGQQQGRHRSDSGPRRLPAPVNSRGAAACWPRPPTAVSL